MAPMARQRTTSKADTQGDSVVLLYSDDECVQRLAALLKHKDTRNLPESDRKADQPSCRPYRVTQTLMATADQVIE